MKQSVLLLSSVLLFSGAALATYQTGETPPNFSCVDVYGDSFTLSEQLGKVVMINFGATW